MTDDLKMLAEKSASRIVAGVRDPRDLLGTDLMEPVYLHLKDQWGDHAARRFLMPVAVLHEKGVPTFSMSCEEPRESWQEHFMALAHKAASRSTCKSVREGKRVAIGAVFVRDTVDLVSGYNGVPSKFPHPTVCRRIERGCKSGEGLHLCPCNHAEQNAIANASKNNISLQGTTLYCTARPCHVCMGVLAGVGISRVIYETTYPVGGHADLSSDIAVYRNIPVLQLQEAIDSGVM